MKTMRVMEVKQCAICERTLLVGERRSASRPTAWTSTSKSARSARRSPLDHGWVREGGPIGHTVRSARRRRPLEPGEHLRRRAQAGRGDDRRRARPAAAVDRRSDGVEAARLFNASDAVRTVDGISRSLGEPQASIVVLSGAEPGGRGHARVGHLLVPVPRLAGCVAACPPGRARPRARRARRGIHGLERAFRGWDRGFPGLENPSRPGRLPSYDETWVARE